MGNIIEDYCDMFNVENKAPKRDEQAHKMSELIVYNVLTTKQNAS